MKLAVWEKRALNLLRRLDVQQRETCIGHIWRAVLANEITTRAGKIKKLRTVEEHRVVKFCGVAPWGRAAVAARRLRN